MMHMRGGKMYRCSIDLAYGRSCLREDVIIVKKKKKGNGLVETNKPLEMLSSFQAVLLMTMTVTMQCHMTTKNDNFLSGFLVRSSFNQSKSSPSPQNAQGAMHPMIIIKKNKK